MRYADNRAFEEMLKVARTRLEGRDPVVLAEKSGIPYDTEETVFCLQSLGRDVRISWPDCKITGAVNDWHSLVILHDLDLADGAPLTGELLSFGQLRDGMMRGGGFDRECEELIRTSLGKRTEEELAEICRALDGKIIPSNADFCVVFPFLPRYPVHLKIWFADDEFDASGRMLLDSAADHYLTVEDAVTVGSILLDLLK